MPIPSKDTIAQFATSTLGFDDCRFTDVRCDAALKACEAWLRAGYHGDMRYLGEHLPLKQNPQRLLRGVRSAIIVIKNYRNTPVTRLPQQHKIARYAVGVDYHLVVSSKLDALERHLQAHIPAIRCYCGVDSRPIAERALALKAGIGFLGRNAMVIHPRVGSYFVIGVVLTTHAFEPDEPLTIGCGDCHRCIDACPARAILDNRTIDARKCISYLTTHTGHAVPAQAGDARSGWRFGCDACQEACPYNENAPLTDWREFLPESGVGFDFFDTMRKGNRPLPVPKTSALYRMRKRIVERIGSE